MGAAITTTRYRKQPEAGPGVGQRLPQWARRAGLTWPLPDGLDDAGLEALLFPPPPDVPSDQRPVPDWSAVHRDLRRPNVTLALLWEEYRAATTDGFGYSWFCDLYREWAGG